MKCKQIALAIDLLEENNWKIEEEVTGWTEMNLVVYFKPRLTEKMRDELKKISGLEYYLLDKDLHYAREEAFVCKKCKIAISFPLH